MDITLPSPSSANWISLLCQPLLSSFALGLLTYTYTNRGCEHPPLGSVHTSVCLIPPSRCSRALSLVHRFRRSLLSAYLWLLSSLSLTVCINSNPHCRVHLAVYPQTSGIPTLPSVGSMEVVVSVETTMSEQVRGTMLFGGVSSCMSIFAAVDNYFSIEQPDSPFPRTTR